MPEATTRGEIPPAEPVEVLAARLLEAADAVPWSAYFTTHGDPYVVPSYTPWLTRRIADVSTSPTDYGRANAELLAAAPDLARGIVEQANRHRQVLADLVDRIEGEGYTGWAAELRTEHGL